MGVWTPGQVRAILQRAAGRYWASNEGVFEMRGLRQSWRLGGLVEVAGRLAPETDQKLFARPANEPEPARLLDGATYRVLALVRTILEVAAVKQKTLAKR